MAEMPAGYDLWKTRSPDDAYGNCDDADMYERFERDLDDESLLDACERDEVAPGFHRHGPYVVRLFENGDFELVSTVVLPSRVGWGPVF